MIINLKYIITDGSKGNITSNAFSYVSNLDGGSSSNLVITNLPNTVNYNSDNNLLDSYNSPGYDPQTVQDAKEDSANYVFTYDTLPAWN